ncbi:MAG: CinA family protein [Bacteroidales bacterium]|nr:CinA family protein [Bacteroidales bacterium]
MNAEKKNPQTELKRLLSGSGLKLSAAESCTGGQISHIITTVAGASEYYLGSVTSYAAEIKEKILGVKRETIEREGLVSEAVAKEMAQGVRLLCGSDFSVSTTGLAGPGDDERGNPEGTVWIGLSSRQKTVAFKRYFSLGREQNIEKFAEEALNLLTEFIKKETDLK